MDSQSPEFGNSRGVLDPITSAIKETLIRQQPPT
ncbi:hypothetical protein OOU_Y34scaffold00666g233 [Pyricularia oryzae Y34]|uniref:Uncharacterized protein n=1 Tax=Pyricularia oryzae (strain Y34) TaxID=1143189 RepID=A0AA97NUC5_PYRO3|nr:hypothetical protein OOU_Y34scaffold00666g233 [Pyricularia oryzae Y34]